MALNPSDLKRQLQDHLQEGLLLIVGTGLSIAEGIPGMGPLAEHLKTEIPRRIAMTPDKAWADILTALNSGDHLEAAMAKTTLKPETVDAIVATTAALIAAKEKDVFEQVLTGRRVLPFTVFAKHLFKAGRRFHAITPNYDRLIELAAEAAHIGVDSRFFGYLHGRPDPKRSADAHRESYIVGRSSQFRPRQSLCVYKPHGSLDWHEVDGNIVRCPVAVNRVPLIITPGASKYRASFKWAFDDQRSAGNRAASSATKFMFIGYGFNDEHLEQYLCPSLRLTKPSVIVTRDLSANGLKVLQNSRGTDVKALTAVSSTDLRTRISTSAGEECVVDECLWTLEGFNKGII